MRIFLLVLFLSCSPTTDVISFDRSAFENEWWEINEYGYQAGFNFHESGDLLMYEERIYTLGPFLFEEPNVYHSLEYDEYSFLIYENDDCWKVEGYKDYTLDACVCTLRQ